MSPPCQPYTRTGLKNGSKDTRAKSFLYLMDMLPKMEHPPSYILVENVKGFEVRFYLACQTELHYVSSYQVTQTPETFSSKRSPPLTTPSKSSSSPHYNLGSQIHDYDTISSYVFTCPSLLFNPLTFFPTAKPNPTTTTFRRNAILSASRFHQQGPFLATFLSLSI
ncbi:hypothetical protein BC938DRAFT_481186 [Jimgerdemannia flammicorona]|uniref:S-adenosyl-L-methionine-dependent methyltransferase n=1 Tax=Jimgerdemannia flammicorona TaxID=994334 RepID=A0A433R0E5_9FUNG|nr:hypothetical protein BC938DRAFT_481186 [Jimgerdemannia flammicorona]